MFQKSRWTLALGALLTAAMAHSQDEQAPAPSEAPAPIETTQAVPAAADAAAQTQPAAAVETPTAPPPPTARVRSDLLEEIVVTAQKREENISRVPISIQAFTPEALAARGIDSQLGLTRAVPSLDVGSQAGYATIFLRGIGTEAFLTADPSIASYVDGVYFPFSPTFVQDFAGVERVEVLKGPQGTLFGRNAVGGAISVTTAAPDFEERKTTFDVTVGRFNLVKPRVYTNIPVSDTFAVNLSAYYSNADYYLDGTSAGKPLRRQIDQGVRAKARWAPLEELDVTVGFTRTKNQGNGAIGQNLNPSPLGQALQIAAPEDRRSIEVDERLYGVSETRLINGQVTYNAPWLDVKLLGSDQLNSLLYNYDFDGSPQPLVSFDVPGHPANIQQGELQLISNESAPTAEWLDVAAGVFFFKNTQGFDPVQLTVANFDPTAPGGLLSGLNAVNQLPAGFGNTLTGIFGNGGLLQDLSGNLVPDPRLYRVLAQAQVKTESIGYYMQFTARFNEYMALTLGGRYQDEERGLHRSTVDVQVLQTALGETFVGGPPINFQNARDEQGRTVPGKRSTKGFFPKATIDFHPFGDDNTLLFASAQRAEKAHAYNAFAIYLPPQYIRPEETTAYEIGLKTKLFDGNTRVNVAVFRYDIKDLQTQYVSLLSGGALAFENAPKAESKGIDFDIVSELFPETVDGLAISLNGAYIDAKFGSYPGAAGYDPATGLFSPNNDFTGNRQTRTPKFSGTVALTKLWSFGNSEFEVGADYYYNDGFFYSASNDPRYEQPSYHLVGSFARYAYLPWKTSIRVFGNNLTDEFYTQGVISTDFGGVFTVAPPVTYGVNIAVEF